MISKEGFSLLSFNDQVQTTLEYGTEILYRQYLYFTIKLFSLEDFFVEIWYLPVKNKIDKIEVLNRNDIFNFYEKNIDISDLFKK